MDNDLTASGQGATRPGVRPGTPRHGPHLLQEVMRTSQALLAVFSREVGMPASRLALLRLLAIAHPEGLGAVRLAREMGIDAAAITRAVKDLEAEQLVVIRSHARDARRRTVVLTAKGRRAFDRLHARGHELETGLVTNLSARDLATTMRTLARLRTAIEAVRWQPVSKMLRRGA